MYSITGMNRYTAMEAVRTSAEWLGSTAKAVGEHPAFALSPLPGVRLLSAWGQVAERSYSRMADKPDWGIQSITSPQGQDHIVYVDRVLQRDFCDLLHFRVARREPMARKVLVIAPMSGHYATLLRPTVASLLPDAEVYVTDWRNARDIPVSCGKFDVEDFTRYVMEFMKYLSPDLHVLAVCQPAPPALAATALLAEHDPAAQPKSLTLMGGPINPDATPSDVTDFGSRHTMGELEYMMIQQVSFRHAGAGRLVYPGLAQLGSFIAMNLPTHSKAFIDQTFAVARGEAGDHDRHNRFYDEYLAVMDMTAEFYLSTVDRIFKKSEIANNRFTVDGQLADIKKIRDVWVMTVEGAEDDISPPGQCVAALDLCSNVPANRKRQHLEEGAGHYGIFAGKNWRLNIRPAVLDFMDDAAGISRQQRKRGGPAASLAAEIDSPASIGRVGV